MNLDAIILAELQRGGPQPWVSGRVYPKGWEVRSLANLQRYVRKVAGAGDTDPSADAANWEPWSKTVDTTLADLGTSVANVKAVADALATTLGSVRTSVDASATPLWRTGETVQQWDYRKSPLDGEIYQRKTATVGGATDPADDLTNYVSISWQRPTALVNDATRLSTMEAYGSALLMHAFQPATSTAMVAGQRTLIEAVTGKGYITRGGFSFAGMGGKGSKNVRLELLVDGRAILDKTFTTNSVDSNSEWIPFVGDIARGYNSTGFAYAITESRVEFARSFALYLTIGWTPPTPAQVNKYLQYQGRS